MQSFITSTPGAFRTVLTAGAVALTIVGTTLATAAPAEAFVRHGGGFHGGGLRHGGGFHGGGFHRVGGFGGARFGGVHRFGYGHGRPFGGGGFRRGIVGHRGFGVRRFVYGIGIPYDGHGFRRCPVGRHFVPGLGCRVNAVYGTRTFGYTGLRPVFAYGGLRHAVHRFDAGFGRPFGGHRHGIRHAGFGGFHQGGGFRHGGGGFRHGGHVRHR